MMKRRSVAIITTIIILLAAVAALVPTANTPIFVSPLLLNSPLFPPFTPSHFSYQPLILCDGCPTATITATVPPTLIGVTETPEPPTPTIPPTLPRPGLP